MEPLKELSHVVQNCREAVIWCKRRAATFNSERRETIKDTMFLPEGVPTVFVLPKHFFNWRKGVGIRELEFPIY